MRANVMLRVVVVIGILVFFAPVAQAGSGGGGTPPGLPPEVGALSCRVVDGEDVSVGVTLADTYGTRQVNLRRGQLLCTAVTVTSLPGEPAIDEFTGANAHRCYSLSNISSLGQTGPAPPDLGLLTDGLHSVSQTVQIGGPQYLCLPARVVE
jgi:hypothetical protein